mgnify:CR=1 FL=1
MSIDRPLAVRAGLLGLAFAVMAGPAAVHRLTGAQTDRALAARGAELAGVYCASCHLEPRPEILPQQSWRAALGYMGYYLGNRAERHPASRTILRFM